MKPRQMKIVLQLRKQPQEERMKTFGRTTLLFVLLPMFVFLTSCSSLPERDARTANDLQVLREGVRLMSEPRLPAPVNGSNRMEDQTLFPNAYLLGLNLEDTNWLLNGDKQRIYRFVDFVVTRIELDRQPNCRLWDYACWKQRRKLKSKEP